MSFSFFDAPISNPIPAKQITVEDFLEILKNPNPAVEKIRQEENKKKRNALKEERLNYVTFAGKFSYRNNESLVSSSGLVCLDIDELEDVQKIKQKIVEKEYTNVVFISPSGNGLKVLVKIPEVNSGEEYKLYYKAVQKYYNIKSDNTSDISRGCYISYDPDYYYNPDSKIFTDKIETENKEKIKTDFATADKTLLEDEVFPHIKTEVLTKITQGNINGYASRSERDVAVINHLLLKGLEDYIKPIFDLYPIGEKYRTEKKPEYYLQRQIDTARKYTGVINSDFAGLLEKIKNSPKNVLQNQLKSILESIGRIPNALDKNVLKSELSNRIKLSKRELDCELNKIIPPKPISFLELLNKKEVKREYHIKGFLPKGQLILLGARPENFKTQLAISSTIGILSKNNLAHLEIECQTPKIFFYSLEMSSAQFARASKTFLNGFGVKDYSEELSNLQIQEVFSFEYETELRKLKDFDIVIIDSLRRVLKGSEDDSSNTAEFYTHFIKKLVEAGKTIILIAHSRKGGKDGVVNLLESDNNTLLDLVRGSGDIGAQLDTGFILHKSEEYREGDKKEFVVVLRNCKNRDALDIRKANLIKIIAELDKEGSPIKTTFENYDLENVPLTKIEEAILIKRFIGKKCILKKDGAVSNKRLFEAFEEFVIYNSKLQVPKREFDFILDRLRFFKRKMNFAKNGKETSSTFRVGLELNEGSAGSLK